MNDAEEIVKPSKQEQQIAMESYNALREVLKQLRTDNPEIEIEETNEKIRIPLKMLKLLVKILEVTSQGKPFSLVPQATEMTTQAAAEFLGCSRPHIVKLLEENKIPYTKVGRHRRIKFEDLIEYKKEMKANQKDLLIQMMRSDEELGLYDS